MPQPAVRGDRPPDPHLFPPLASAAGLTLDDGHVSRPGATADLGDRSDALAELEARLRDMPFTAPDRDELAALRLGPKELAAAVRIGRILDLGDRHRPGPPPCPSSPQCRSRAPPPSPRRP